MGLLGMLSSAGSSGGVNVGTAVAYLELNTERFSAGLDTAVSKLSATSGNFASSLKNVGSAMTNMGSALTKSVTLPVVGLGTAAVKTFAEFEQGMADVKAIAGQVADSKEFERVVNIGKEMGLSYKEGADMTETAMNIVKAKAEQVGASTEWTSAQAAEAFKYMAMAGWQVGDMLYGIDPIINLATASEEDLGTVSDIVTDALTAFGLEAKDTAHFTDILAQAARSSNTTVQKMGESFKFVAPVMGSLGMSAEDTAVALGLMANNGIKSGMAGRALKNVLTNLSTGAGDAGKAMADLDISLEKSDGSMKTLKELFDELREKFKSGTGDVEQYTKAISELDKKYADGKITEDEYADRAEQLATALYGAEGAEKARLAAMLAGKQGMAGLLSIVNATEEDYNRLTSAIENCSGATDEMAEIMRDTTENKIKLMTSAIDAMMRSFGELLAPSVMKAANAIKEFADKINNLDDGTKQMIITFASIAAAVGPVLIVLGSLAKSISSIITLFTSLSGGISALAGTIGVLGAPVGLIIAGLAAFAAAIIYLWNTNEDFRNKMIAAWEKIKIIVSDAIKDIKAAIEEMEPVFESLKTYWNWIIETWGEMFTTQVQSIVKMFEGAVEFITGILQIIGGVIKGFKDGDWTMLWEGIINVISGALEIIVGIVRQFANWFLAPFKFIYDELLGHSIIPDICEGMISCFTDAFENTVGLVKEFVEKVIQWFEDLWEKIKEKLQEISDTAKEYFNKIVDIAKEFGPKMLQAGKDIVTSLWDGMKEVFEKLWAWVEEHFGKIINFVQNAAEKAQNVGGDIIDGSHATGLSYVPFNGYIAELHEGERVLTKQENRAYTSGRTGGGDTYNIYSYEKLDEYNIKRELMKMKRQLDL